MVFLSAWPIRLRVRLGVGEVWTNAIVRWNCTCAPSRCDWLKSYIALFRALIGWEVARVHHYAVVANSCMALLYSLISWEFGKPLERLKKLCRISMSCFASNSLFFVVEAHYFELYKLGHSIHMLSWTVKVWIFQSVSIACIFDDLHCISLLFYWSFEPLFRCFGRLLHQCTNKKLADLKTS